MDGFAKPRLETNDTFFSVYFRMSISSQSENLGRSASARHGGVLRPRLDNFLDANRIRDGSLPSESASDRLIIYSITHSEQSVGAILLAN